jgi:hypothetical protein
MNRNTLTFIALAITILYGVGFAAFDGDVPTAYAAIGAGIVALSWIAVGMLSRDSCDGGSRDS